MTPQEDDVLLVLLVQSGDTAAFEKLLRRLHTPMRKYVRNLAGESNADDILQDVAWQIFRQIRHLREPKVFRAWVFRIATRISFHYLRRQKRWHDMENDPELIRSMPGRPPLEPDELDADFQSLIERVSPSNRAVLLLHRRVPFTVIMVIGLMLVVITSKIAMLINKNTTAILRAIAGIEEQVRIQSERQAIAKTTELPDKDN